MPNSIGLPNLMHVTKYDYATSSISIMPGNIVSINSAHRVFWSEILGPLMCSVIIWCNVLAVT